MESEDPSLQDPSLVPDEFDNMHHHQALAMDYYLDAYEVFLSGQDVYPEQDKALEERYGRLFYMLIATRWLTDQQRKRMKRW